MGFLTNMLKMGSDSNTDGPTSGGAPEEQGPGSGGAGYRADGSNPYLDKAQESSPWNTILGMSQAGGTGKSMLATPGENEDYNSSMGQRARAGMGGNGAGPAVNPKAAAWDRYVGAYSPKGDGAPPDPQDAQLFNMIWD